MIRVSRCDKCGWTTWDKLVLWGARCDKFRCDGTMRRA